jgi:hypothetical protein
MKNYKGVIFPDATFPDSPYRTIPVHPNTVIVTEYIPALDTTLPDTAKGLKLLMTAMCIQEGFNKGTRSYRTNNPGNIGNGDNGANNGFKTLSDGIKAQADYLTNVANGGNNNYPLNKPIVLYPYHSPEIEAHPEYGLPSDLPGYKLTYTGQLDQFIKIYSTGARASNNYLNVICSYFFQNGLDITPTSILSDIITMDSPDISQQAIL